MTYTTWNKDDKQVEKSIEERIAEEEDFFLPSSMKNNKAAESNQEDAAGTPSDELAA
jgi:cytochrome c oxidase assembly protein subunit 11